MASVVYLFICAVGILLGVRVGTRARSASSVWLMAGGIILMLLGFSFVIGGLWSAGQLTGRSVSSGHAPVNVSVSSPT